MDSIGILLDRDEEMLQFLLGSIPTGLRLPGQRLREESENFSPGQRLLIQAALDLWDGSGRLCLTEALDIWEEDNWIRFIRALCHRKEIRYEVLCELIADENPARGP